MTETTPADDQRAAGTPEPGNDRERQASIPSPPEGTTKEPSLQGQLEALARITAFIGLLAYALGLVSVNAYLLSFGVSEFSLLRPRFVYTGTLVLAVLALAGFWVHLAGRLLRPQLKDFLREKRPWRRMWLVLLAGSTLLGTLLSPLAAFSFLMRSGDVGTTFRGALLVLAVGAVGVLLGGATGLFDVWAGGPQRARWRDRLAEDPLLPFTIAGWIVAFLYVFTRFVYPVVPEQFGGGKPTAATLVVEATARESISDLGLPMAGEGEVSECVQLLFVGEEAYVVGAADGAAIQVARGIVAAVRIEPGSC